MSRRKQKSMIKNLEDDMTSNIRDSVVNIDILDHEFDLEFFRLNNFKVSINKNNESDVKLTKKFSYISISISLKNFPCIPISNQTPQIPWFQAGYSDKCVSQSCTRPFHL